MPAQIAICVVGSINMDLVFRTPRMPAPGETISGHEFAQIAGGKGANQAVAAARQGARTALIACVGDDAYGKQSLAALQQDGIDTGAIEICADCATGVAGIFVDDSGQNSIVIAPGANAKLTPAHIEAARQTLSGAQILLCQCETPMPTIQAAIALAHAQGVKVVFNAAPATTLPDGLLAQVSHLIVNETEAAQLSGVAVTDLASARSAAQRLLAKGVQCVLLTLGKDGVCIARASQFHHLPGLRVAVVDSTAAGDAFVGAFATALANGMNETDAAQQAQYCAALTVTKLGAQSAIPHRADVEKFKTGVNALKGK